MKRYVLSLLMALVVLCSVTIFASAAEADSDIKVQLDGQNLEFTDAKPQIKDNRTFLPYRAVFEAMGAEVGYEGNVVTAKRGDTELSMTIGETTATVTRDGATEELAMDVAPYIDSATWRTYVPVRFAADAFGCNVGWDQAAQTAILVDVDKLVEDALAGKEFTLLEKYVEYSEQYSVGSWAVDGTMDASVSLLGSEALPILTGTVDGIVSGETAAEMGMAMDMDMTALMSYLASIQGGTLADLGVTEEELRMNMSMDMKMDLEDGTMYFKFDDTMNAATGLPSNTWLAMDMNTIMSDSGMEWDYNAMMAQFEKIDTAELLKALIAEISLDDRAADGYATLAATLDTTITALSDEGFKKTANGNETSLTFTMEGAELTIELILTTNSAGNVNGYSMNMFIDLTPDAETQASLAALGMPVSQISMNMTTSMDKNDQMDTVIQVSIAPLLTMNMTMEMDYNTTTKTPDTTLPTNAAVVDYMEYMAGVSTPIE